MKEVEIWYVTGPTLNDSEKWDFYKFDSTPRKGEKIYLWDNKKTEHMYEVIDVHYAYESSDRANELIFIKYLGEVGEIWSKEIE